MPNVKYAFQMKRLLTLKAVGGGGGGVADNF